MTTEDELAQFRSYLAAQSAKLSAADLKTRLDEAGAEFFAAATRATEKTAHTAPAAGEWTVAQIVEHVALTLEDVLPMMRALAEGRRPDAGMASHQPTNVATPYPQLVARVHTAHAGAVALLNGLRGDPHADLRVADGEFGEIGWKGYALILRVHYKDHAQQVEKTLAGAESRPR